MKICLKRRKQLLSFLPVKLSINDSEKRYLSVNRCIYHETEEKEIQLKYGLFNLNQETNINLNTSDNTEIECYFNLNYNDYTAVIGGLITVLAGLAIFIIDNNEISYLIVFIVALFIFIQKLNNSLMIKKIQ